MTVAEYKCPACGGRLEFDPKTQNLACPYCSSAYAIPDSMAPNAAEQPGEPWDTVHGDVAGRHFDTKGNDVAPEEAAFVSYVCPSCGGEIVGDATTVATRCPYCDSPAVVPSQTCGLLTPDLIVPFKKTRKDAEAAFAKNCAKRILLPRGYASEQRLKEITGLYVPFWLFDCKASGRALFSASDTTTHGDTTETSYYDVERAGRATFANIPADASSLMDDVMMESIEAFDTTEARPFSNAYLSGYLANRYDVEPAAVKGRVRERAEESLKQQLTGTVSHDSVSLQTFSGEFELSEPRYALYPVWTLASHYGGEVYHFTMNGQTGKFTGRLPVSKARTALLFVVTAVAVSALAMLAMTLFEMDVWLGAVLGTVFAGIFTGITYSGMNTHQKASGCCPYLSAPGFELTYQEDIFRHSEVTKRESSN